MLRPQPFMADHQERDMIQRLAVDGCALACSCHIHQVPHRQIDDARGHDPFFRNCDGMRPGRTAFGKASGAIYGIDDEHAFARQPVFTVFGFLGQPTIVGACLLQHVFKVRVRRKVRLGHGACVVVLVPDRRVASEEGCGDLACFLACFDQQR